MEEMIAQIAQSAGIDTETAKKAVGTILGFLQKEAPADAMNQLLEKIPGADQAIADAQASGGGGGLMGAIGGLMGGGGGLMGLAGQLQGLGLGMGEMQSVGKTLFAQGRELVGEDVMGQIAGSVPGLSQFT
jgi:hypothetical protein